MHLITTGFPDSKVHGANMGPTWVLSAPDGPHVGHMNLAILVIRLLVVIVDNTVCAAAAASMIWSVTLQECGLRKLRSLISGFGYFCR